jgi:Tol biopolymer transport system component
MPNGGAIAWDIFDSKVQEGYIYRMSASGGGKSSLVASGTVPGCPQHPAWSPDQTEVAFSNGTYCADGGNPPSIYVRATSGGTATQVAAGYEPDWGPKP